MGRLPCFVIAALLCSPVWLVRMAICATLRITNDAPKN
jgi:hypothetical protein